MLKRFVSKPMCWSLHSCAHSIVSHILGSPCPGSLFHCLLHQLGLPNSMQIDKNSTNNILWHWLAPPYLGYWVLHWVPLLSYKVKYSQLVLPLFRFGKALWRPYWQNLWHKERFFVSFQCQFSAPPAQDGKEKREFPKVNNPDPWY